MDTECFKVLRDVPTHQLRFRLCDIAIWLGIGPASPTLCCHFALLGLAWGDLINWLARGKPSAEARKAETGIWCSSNWASFGDRWQHQYIPDYTCVQYHQKQLIFWFWWSSQNHKGQAQAELQQHCACLASRSAPLLVAVLACLISHVVIPQWNCRSSTVATYRLGKFLFIGVNT